MPVGAEQRARLLEAKLRSLVRTRWGDARAESVPFPGGVALRDGDAVRALLEAASPRSLGGALVWAHRRGAASLDLLVDDAGVAAELARRAALAALPVSVWVVVGPELREPAPAPVPAPPPPPDVADLRAAIVASGAEVVVEHGIVRGEVAGLEVARVELLDDGSHRLDVGIGRFDREISAMLHAGEPPGEALASAVELVRRHRQPAAAPHPLNRLARPRWVRAAVLADAAALGLHAAEPADMTLVPHNVRDPFPAAIRAGRILAVCGDGTDVDLLVEAADTAAWHGAGDVLVVTPSGSLPAAVRESASLLRPAIRFVEVPPPWG